MSDNSIDQIAESIGTITEEQEDENDGKEQEDETETFDLEEYRRNLDEYDGGWEGSH